MEGEENFPKENESKSIRKLYIREHLRDKHMKSVKEEKYPPYQEETIEKMKIRK